MRILNLLFISLICLSATVLGQNFNDALRLSDPGLGANARALGMGNAYNAISDDYSAVYYNPAGLGLIKRMEFSGSITYDNFGNNVTFFNNETKDSKSSFSFTQFGFVFPLPTVRGSMVLGVGYSRSKTFNSVMAFDGFNTTNTSKIQHLVGFNDPLPWELYLSEGSSGNQSTIINGRLNQSGSIKQEGSIDKWSFSWAFEAAQGLFVGATLNLHSGDFESNNNYYEDDTRDVYDNNLLIVSGQESTRGFLSFGMNDIIKWDLTGWDFKLGMLYNYRNLARYSFSVKFPSFYTVEEDYFVDGYSEFGPSFNNVNSYYDFDPPVEAEYSYDIRTPFEFSGGMAFSVKPFVLSGDITLIDYTQMEFTDGLTDEFERQNLNAEIEDLMTTVVNFNLGAEWNLNRLNTRFRAGFMYKPSPYKGDDASFDRKYITLGAGILPDEVLSFDIGYAFGWWDSIGDNYGNPNDSRTFQELTHHSVVVSVFYRY